MQTETITMERGEAAKLYRKYREHRAWSKPIDQEIERIYHAIAKGKVIIRALESIRAAGLGADGFPKLAIARADAEVCFVDMYVGGGARMATERWVNGRTAHSRYVQFEDGTFANTIRRRFAAEAIIPHIPPDIRPARGIENYHVLFEAKWSKIPPYDPMLLRRIGKGDTWLVVAAWDLTEIERAAMAGRIRA